MSCRRAYLSYLAVALVCSLVGHVNSKTAAFADSKQCVSDNMIEEPEMARSGWLPSYNIHVNSDTYIEENNYVWPMESSERMFFFVRGLGMLYNASAGQFRITEPAVCDNKLVMDGSPLSSFIKFEKFGSVQTSRGEWASVSGQPPGKGKAR